MAHKTRLAGVVVAILAAALLAGCGDDKKGNGGKPKTPVLACDLNLSPDEKNNSFNKKSLSCDKTGTVKITVTNPTNAKGQHGVGIDGGTYKNVKGAPVKPGRSTSLTVDLKAGKYVVFDSYRKNRDKGYETTLTVKK